MSDCNDDEMQRGSNWSQIVQNTVDQYDDPIHGVQKDAIQNGKDAILPRGKNDDGTLKKEFIKNNWKFSFELSEIRARGQAPVRALMMTDYGTTGLIGEKRVGNFGPDEEIPLEEKWARFESYAQANEGGQTLGARGQGKFVFISASNQKKIIYDTRKINGKYRVGYTTVSIGSSPVYAKEGKEGENWIRDNCGLKPVHSEGLSGTRIIIVDPNEYLIRRLESGEFLENIKETWWPFIRDYGARIEVTVGGITSVATVPSTIEKINKGIEDANFKLWKKDGLTFKYGKRTDNTYALKEFRIASFTSGGLSNNYRGIAIFRGGMKVQTTQTLFGYEFEDRISGYVLLDPAGDEKLREVEKPSHYEFKPEGIWRKLQLVIKEESKKFGADKLGIGINKTTNPDEQRQAEVSKALQILRFISKDWPLNFAAHGPGPGPGAGPTTRLKKIHYVYIKDFKFPNLANIERLNWGQSVSGWWIRVGNREPKASKLFLECNVFSLSGKKLLNFLKKEIFLAPESASDFKRSGTGLEFIARKDIFVDPGKYKLTATLTDLKTKKIIDEDNQNIWIETDPPPKAPFDMKPANFSEILPEEAELEWKLEYSEKGIIVYYNIDHPSFDVASRNKSVEIYLGEIAGMAGLQLLIGNVNTLPAEEARAKKLPFSYSRLFGQDPVEQYLELMKMHDIIRHKILSNYLS